MEVEEHFHMQYAYATRSDLSYFINNKQQVSLRAKHKQNSQRTAYSSRQNK